MKRASRSCSSDRAGASASIVVMFDRGEVVLCAIPALGKPASAGEPVVLRRKIWFGGNRRVELFAPSGSISTALALEDWTNQQPKPQRSW